METPAFSELGLAPYLLQTVDKLGYESPSPIQALTIPRVLSGKDVVGLSETGSGKTAAFGLPALQKLDPDMRFTQVLVLCPTRELSIQVCEEIHKLGAGLKSLTAIPVYGGAPIDRQIRYLRQGSQIVVGTPGRLMDHLNRGTLVMNHVRMVILDEADRMLDMGFRDDMETILAQVPSERQTLFFSATMNQQVERLIEHFGKDPEQVRIQRKTLTVASVEQSYFEVRNRSKIEVLSRLLDIDPPKLAIVFCNTKRAVDDCCDALVNRGYAADRIHGDITQVGRERVLKAFRSGKVEILVATDVAARGLDIDEVEAVFNYDLPQDPEDYVHRIGRTGRAGRGGRAYSFVFGKDLYRLGAIERYIKQTIPRSRIPSLEDIAGRQTDTMLELAKDRLDSGTYRSYGDGIEVLLEQGYSATDIAGALFSLLKEQTNRDGEAIIEDKEPLKPERGRTPKRSKNRPGKKTFSPPDKSGASRGKKTGGHAYGESLASGKRKKKKNRHNADKGKPAWTKHGKKRHEKESP